MTGEGIGAEPEGTTLDALHTLSDELAQHLDTGDTQAALALISTLRPADAADVVEALPDVHLAVIFGSWAPDEAAEILEELDPDRRSALAERIPPGRLADVLDAMPPDEAADFLQRIDPEHRAVIIGRMEREEASDVAELLDFPEDSAGRRMSQDFFAVGLEETADEVIAKIREVPEDIELIYYVYVLGGSEQLRGVVSLRDLIVSSPDTRVEEIMISDIVSVRPEEHIEAVVDMVHRYNLLAVPVTDDIGRMLGIVTVDDILETIEEEAEQDVLRFAGSIEDEDPDRRRTWPAVRRRLPWLAIATLIELGIAYLLLRPLPGHLLVLTVAYIPLLVFVGGNTAVQAAARVLVRLVSGKSESWSPWRQARRELEAGVILAVLAALAAFVVVLAVGQDVKFAAVVAPAMALTVVIGAGLGASLPVLLQRLRFDPAIASGPLLGSAMDLVSVFIYVTLVLTFARYLA